MTNRPTDQPLTIDQAAARLGISREAVRLRLRRGTLRGEHADGAWSIWLVDPQPTSDRPTNRPTRQASKPRTDDHDHLLEEVAYLRAALEREQTASAELRRMLNLEQMTLAAGRSPMLAPIPTDATEGHQMPVTPLDGAAQPNAAAAVELALKDAGLKRKQRRRLVDTLARLLHLS